MGDKRIEEYEAPEVVTYTAEEILEELGPAQAVYGQTPGMNPGDGLESWETWN